MTCDHMNTTYTINCGNTSDCHAGGCRNLYVSRRDWAVLIARRAVEYEEPVRFLVALWLTGLVAWIVYAIRVPK